MSLQPPSIASTSAGQIVTNSFVTANWTDGLAFLLAPPIARLYQTVSQSFANNTLVPITLDSDYQDTYGGHSTTSNTTRYTFQAPGVYDLQAGVSFAASTAGFRQLVFRINGSTTFTKQQESPSPSFETVIQIATQWSFAVGDYVEACAWQNSGAAISTVVSDATVQPFLNVRWVHQ